MATNRRLRAGGDAGAASRADAVLRELYDGHWVGLVRLASLLLGSTDAADEVVQDAYVGLYPRLHRFPDTSEAYAYLRTSVVNGCRSVHRHRGVVARKPVPADAEPDRIDDVVAQRQEDGRVLAAVRTLPERQREVLILRYYADASEAEIADALQISRGAVKVHAHRGMATLRSLLAGPAAQGGDPS